MLLEGILTVIGLVFVGVFFYAIIAVMVENNAKRRISFAASRPPC